MFTSNSNMDHHQQHQPQQPMFERPIFENDINPNSKQDISFSFFQFSPSSCFFDNEDAFFHELQHHLLSVGSTPNDDGGGMVAETKTTSAGTDQKMALVTDNTPSSKLAQPVSKIMNKINTSTTNKRPTTQRKRTGKKDRHSKILTAQGPRDRRMRLNVETAGKFFNVQDMLGVDKASKTVEWLLNMCEPAIKELTISFYKRINELCGGSKSTGSSSMSPECEVQSEIDQEMVVCEQDRGSSNLCKGKSLDSSPTSKGKNTRMLRKATCHPLAKELRAKARERARERTMKKLNSRRLDPSNQYLQGNPNSAFRSLSGPFEKSEDSAGSGGSQDMTSSGEMVQAPDDDNKLIQNCQSPDPDEPQETTTMDSMDAPADEQSFVITRNLNPNSVYSYHHREIGLRSNSNRRIPADLSEIWDITSNAAAGTSSGYSSMTSNLDLLPAGNIQNHVPIPIPLSSLNVHLQTQFLYGKPNW